jgi:hypothetical protein
VKEPYQNKLPVVMRILGSSEIWVLYHFSEMKVSVIPCCPQTRMMFKKGGMLLVEGFWPEYGAEQSYLHIWACVLWSDPIGKKEWPSSFLSAYHTCRLCTDASWLSVTNFPQLSTTSSSENNDITYTNNFRGDEIMSTIRGNDADSPSTSVPQGMNATMVSWPLRQ